MAQILVNVRPMETRVAYVENGVLTDLKMERSKSPTLVGSIHRGKVMRVLPGMQAAFVDIGLDRAAFLYVGDVRTDLEVGPPRALLEEDEADEESNESALIETTEKSEAPEVEEPKIPIQDLIKEGQFLLVQVAKDPLGTKGARITTQISLPGRHIVYMPTMNQVGISRRIEDEQERERLLEVIENLSKKKGGIIVRTAGEGASETNIRSDYEYLERLWKDISKSYEKRKSPGVIHTEMDVTQRALRDWLSEDVEKVLVDDDKEYRGVVKFVTQFMPKFKSSIQKYNKPKPLFDLYDIDLEISRSMDRKIWLKSGGYIVIDEAEALVVIDVNTGRYVGKKDLEDTILKTNLESVKEIAHQLRIRNCGGIIIIDFIDMEKPVHREMVLENLRKELESDRVRTKVVSMSELGLVEMTRKRIRPSLVKNLCDPCSYCDGKGYIKSRSTVAHEIFREIEREAPSTGREQSLVINCHSGIADLVYESENETLEYLEKKYQRAIVFKVEPTYHIEQYELRKM